MMTSRSPKQVLLAGCGDLGTEVGLRLIAGGAAVTGVRRRAELLPESFAQQSVDLREGFPVVGDDVDLVVVALTAEERTAEAYRAAYLEGLRNVLDAIDVSAADPRIVLVSSTAVYDVDDDSIVDETTPATGRSATGGVLLETEQLLRERVPGGVILRLGGIYGPGRERLLDQVRQGGIRVSPESPFTNRIHRDDAARAILHLGSIDSPPSVVLGVDDEPVRLGDVLRFLATEMGAEEPGSGSSGHSAAGSKRLSNALLHSTGFEFTYPTFREGYRAVLAGTGARHP